MPDIAKVVATFKEANPEAYESIKGEGYKLGQVAGHDEGVASEKERVKLLADCVTFKASQTFVLEQIAKGNELSKAKAEYADLLAQENERLKAKAAEVAERIRLADAAHEPTSGTPNPLPTPQGGQSNANADAIKRFDARVQELVSTKKISKAQAVNAVYAQERDLYEAYMEAKQQPVRK